LDLDRHELVPRDFGHCVEDSIIQGGFADLGGEVSRDHSDRCNHLSALTIEKFDAHERPQLLASRDVSQVRALAAKRVLNFLATETIIP
jgi:hypothetical protein